MSYRKFLGAAALTLVAGLASAAFPERELTGVIMWGAGGAIGRRLACGHAARRGRRWARRSCWSTSPAAPGAIATNFVTNARPTATRCSTAPRTRSCTRCWASPISATRSSIR